ncbi:MAG: glycosyltransferase family 2 protein, partial [Melioribacteraceae bacterium]
MSSENNNIENIKSSVKENTKSDLNSNIKTASKVSSSSSTTKPDVNKSASNVTPNSATSKPEVNKTSRPKPYHQKQSAHKPTAKPTSKENLTTKENIPKKESTSVKEDTTSKESTSNKTKPYVKRKPRRNYSSSKNHYNKNKAKSGSGNSSRLQFRKVSVLVPLYNEEESLTTLTSEIKNAFSNISSDYEILFIDDGSDDDSLKVLRNLARADSKIHYISFRKNYGKSAALNIGFKNVTGDAVITMDADLQDDPAEIPALLKKLQEGYDLVSGWKKQRHDPFIKKFSSRFFNYITKVMSGIKIHDFNCGLKAYRRDVVKNVTVHGELHRYIPVLADWKGFKISEIVVKHHPRRYGKTKFGISRFFKGFIDLITVIFTTRYIQRPLHFFG